VNGRQDFVVIMARGSSTRMGRTKGLLTCQSGGESRPFVDTIVRLYENIGLGGVVLTTANLVADYEGAIRSAGGFCVVACPPGGETGRTVWHGWQLGRAGHTHLWAHPVDLPLVQEETLGELRQASISAPERLVRPCYDGAPGHPVIMPMSAAGSLAAGGLAGTGTAREVIAKALQRGQIGAVVSVPVLDAGVVCDFDRPEDLPAATGW